MLFENIYPEEIRFVKFVVLVAETGDREEYIANITHEILSNFRDFIEEGLLEVILPPVHWYPPNLKSLPPTLGDSPERMYWRAKLCLDYAYLMFYVRHFYTDSGYYVHLEDDIISVPGYISAMLHYATTHKEWFSVDFSKRGFIGKLFHRFDLPIFIDFILMFYKDKPVDWILDQFFKVKFCRQGESGDLCIKKRINNVARLFYDPPLFEHIGTFSSSPGLTHTNVENITKTFVQKSHYVENFTKPNNPKLSELVSDLKFVNITEKMSYKFYYNATPIEINQTNRTLFLNISFPSVASIAEIQLNFAYISYSSIHIRPIDVFAEVYTHNSTPFDNVYKETRLNCSNFRCNLHPPWSTKKLSIRISNHFHKFIFYMFRIL